MLAHVYGTTNVLTANAVVLRALIVAAKPAVFGLGENR